MEVFTACGPNMRRRAAKGVNAPAGCGWLGKGNARRPVSRVLFRPRDGDDHSSGPALADRLSRPTRASRAVNPAGEPARRPYSVLLQAGLAMPVPSPVPRWALTPPFHPYPHRGAGGLLSVALSLGSPRAEVIRRLFTVEPGLSSTEASSAATARPSGGATDGPGLAPRQSRRQAASVAANRRSASLEP